MPKPDTTNTLRRCNAIQHRLRNTQLTMERSRALVIRCRAAIDHSVDNLVTCEMRHDISPASALHKRLMQRTNRRALRPADESERTRTGRSSGAIYDP